MYDCSSQRVLFLDKFTAKERDLESGLDNFDARYDSSSLGRFRRDANAVVLSSTRKSGKRMSPDPISVLAKIMAALRLRYKSLNLHYEAAWTDSWSHRRCLHEHKTLMEAAKCAMPRGAGWYVFAVESGTPRELNAGEEAVGNNFRFGTPEIGART